MTAFSDKQPQTTFQRSLGGASPQSVLPAGDHPWGSFCIDDTGLVVWQIQYGDADLTRVWVAVAGAGFAGSLGKYWVAPDLAAAGPRTIYHTLEAAMAAYDADGHNAANPATISMFPGAAYVIAGGRVDVSPGCTIANVANQSPVPFGKFGAGLDVQITGQLRMVGPGQRTLRGLAIQSTVAAADAVLVTGAAADDIEVSVLDCQCFAGAGTNGSGINWTTNTDGALNYQRSQAKGDGTGFGITTLAYLNALDPELFDAATGVSLRVVGPTGVADLTGGTVNAVTLTGAAAATARGTTVTTTLTSGITTAAASIVEGYNCAFNPSGFVNIFAGSGRFFVIDPVMVNALATRASTATVTSYTTWRLVQDAAPAAPATQTVGTDVFTIDTAGGAVVFNLLANAAQIPNKPFTVVAKGIGGTVNITPDAGDQIMALGAGNPYALANGAGGKWTSVTLMWSSTLGVFTLGQ